MIGCTLLVAEGGRSPPSAVLYCQRQLGREREIITPVSGREPEHLARVGEDVRSEGSALGKGGTGLGPPRDMRRMGGIGDGRRGERRVGDHLSNASTNGAGRAAASPEGKAGSSP